ncbi:MAG: AraC family transcriptional regulator [Candidatus Saccharibacteria bacterium]|nr:AraC family transcriptional regulator [Candidatus Saccharibacteria bacterium]
MTGQEIIEKVKALKLPHGSYVVFGSCPLAVVGIREANDIDLYVTSEVLQSFKQQGWQQVHKGPGDKPYTSDDYEAHDNWNFSPYSPSLEHLLETAMVVDGVSFASLQEVRKWKLASGGPKHLKDVSSIDDYLPNMEL